ncbi:MULTISPECIES: hypothetical protein [unclassified Polaromonas]|jgi:hypothetical protein|uniref:hypothetical protein n=1 Tax=unclassified Polaromonas TaxID=2638319 RepID=UPI000BCE200C|nr:MULTISPECIES: hypothetical protein [unclassified Polaromonas]OYY32696.1 MAG: hypothetical protein B7Y60_21560 [Polaromonas sp. 35-63-35]OYZ16137.1 MAG: hypothetical protein B7Y28_21350 [Polaromonas sp. 16-63-31]OYZ75992.1 MAG: hypothetical protein B7Y09_22335 [Polaromonas sp. 24-63-21]OZA52971.1 MAG: hypothetical protein B7X88_03475 [Polaromonas sp. 17-63-33]OZA85431.1 MAG: hypothetical protein B7X65_21485 [Polaromonas sp. 39-63-25]
MSFNTIAEQYELLLKAAMPANASQVQLRKSKRMFYAGAGAVLNMQLHTIAAPTMSETAGVQMLDGLHKEVAAFMREVQAGRA